MFFQALKMINKIKIYYFNLKNIDRVIVHEDQLEVKFIAWSKNSVWKAWKLDDGKY